MRFVRNPPLFIFLLLALGPCPDGAAVAAECQGVTLTDAAEKIALARVAAMAPPRVNFIANPGARKPGCPSDESACALKAFLVPGDEVLAIVGDGPYVCATFKSPRGAETNGWLPRAALAFAPPTAESAQAWEGNWRRDGEASIRLKSRGGEVEVSSEASWGASDPDRVRRGAVNTGEIAGAGKPRDGILAVGYDPGASGAPPPRDAADCAARLRLFGRYLAVLDNGICGGANVSFTGVYVRAPGA
jgi:hypothetical protein